MMTEESPWHGCELQDRTAQILRECGWIADTDIMITLAREQDNIDVLTTKYAEGRGQGTRGATTICMR